MARKSKVHVLASNVDDPSLHSPLTRALIEFSNSPECANALNNLPVPMPKIYEEIPELIGEKVKVYRCHAREHGDNEGCLCDLIGKEIKKTMGHHTLRGVVCKACGTLFLN